MKKFVRWLAKIFKAEITVDGNVCVDGKLNATGEIICFKAEEGGEV